MKHYQQKVPATGELYEQLNDWDELKLRGIPDNEEEILRFLDSAVLEE